MSNACTHLSSSNDGDFFHSFSDCCCAQKSCTKTLCKRHGDTVLPLVLMQVQQVGGEEYYASGEVENAGWWSKVTRVFPIIKASFPEPQIFYVTVYRCVDAIILTIHWSVQVNSRHIIGRSRICRWSSRTADHGLGLKHSWRYCGWLLHNSADSSVFLEKYYRLPRYFLST